ncbi:MAG: LURP-one-related family protein [Erysipelothrix sp.]|jgi:uncharacterized protein YxjI|nr:LURP-one-related family protein [Erysipelothrix sp.]
MKLYIKQKLFSFKDRFTIKDENEVDVLQVEGKVFSFGKQLSVQTMDLQQVAYVKQKVLNFLPTFEITVNDEVHVLKKQFTFFKPAYTLPSLNIRIEGNFTAHQYTILRDGLVIANISKAFFSFADSYEVEILEDKDMNIVIAIVIAIDAVLSMERSSHVNTNNNR